MSKYVVVITETLRREVIVEAENNADAEEVAEALCSCGEIDLTMDDWRERNVSSREAFPDEVEPCMEVYSESLIEGRE